jgi:hypothetical protein
VRRLPSVPDEDHEDSNRRTSVSLSLAPRPIPGAKRRTRIERPDSWIECPVTTEAV